MDGMTLRAAVAELAALRGNRVEDVTAPEAHEIQLVFRKGRIVLGAHPTHNTIHASRTPDVPPGETIFSARIKKGLERCRFDGAVQLGLDRVVILGFSRRDRLGDAESRSVVAELLGKGANLLLVEGDAGQGGRILEQLRPGRQGTGEAYRPPETDKADLTVAGREALVSSLENRLAEGKGEADAVLAAWAGLGPRSAEEVWNRGGSGASPETLAEIWMAFASDTAPASGDREAGPAFSPVHLEMRRSAEALCFKPKADSPARVIEHDTVSEAAEAAAQFFRSLGAARSASPRRKAVRQALKRVERALAQMREEDRESAEAPRLRETGNLLLAFAHEIEKGRTETELTDPNTGETIRIRLNPKLGPAKNAELYFKRARKAERRSTMAAERGRELDKRGNDLKKLLAQLPESGAEPEPSWFQEARRLGVKLPQTDVAKDPKATAEELLPSAIRPRRYNLGQGWVLLVGKSNKGNEVLTHEIARPGDVWMHADQAAGSHAVLRHHEKGKEPPKPLVLTAASIAAFFSKARNASKVPVIVTQKRHVRRARKAPVGTVMVGQHETVMVRPTEPEREDTE